MKKRNFLLSLLLVFLLIGCSSTNDKGEDNIIPQDPPIIDDDDQNDEIVEDDGTITITQEGITANAKGVLVTGTKIQITQEGTYTLVGSSENVQIEVSVADAEKVTLVLNNVNLTSKSGPVVYVDNADKVIINLPNETENFLQDSEDSEAKAVIFSRDDLTFNGLGSLELTANVNNGIDCNDDLVINNGKYILDTANNAIKANNTITIANGNFLITANNDGIKAENNDDNTLGNIAISDGVFNIDASGDGISAGNMLSIFSGRYTIKTGTRGSETSTKGVKATGQILIEDAIFTINSKDDSVHSNASIGIKKGTFVVNSQDDGIHADESLIVDGGNIQIENSYEGLEAFNITINAGDIKIISRDDGLNAAGGNDGSGTFPWSRGGNALIAINGGNIFINASGDGIDANGSITMSGGNVLVLGPTSNNNSSLDYDGTFTISGGVMVAMGSSGMAMGSSTGSTQYGVLINFSSAKTSFALKDESGTIIIGASSSKQFNFVFISTPNLKKDQTYTLNVGGSVTEEEVIMDTLFEKGTYAGGSVATTFTLTTLSQTVGGSGGTGGGSGRPGGRP